MNAVAEINYSKDKNWVYLEKDADEKETDIFFICSTAIEGDDKHFNMDIEDEEMRNMFMVTLDTNKGAFGTQSRVFAPFYRQIGLSACYLSESERRKYFEIGYSDVQSAFEYYMKHFNNGRPFIIAGYSQGAEICIRLVKENMTSKERQDLLVAAYAIGWRITDDDIVGSPQMKMAKGETDTGVIVSYDCESESLESSFAIPKGKKVYSINPLNWKTDSTKADRTLNLGACIFDEEVNVVNEINNFTGCYLDDVRGSLKLTDVPVEDYSLDIDIFKHGDYHWFDLQFFYKNIQRNVSKRIDEYFSKNK